MDTDKSVVAPELAAAIVEQVVVGGDLSQLTPSQRVAYYRRVCDSLGLNWLTKPFEYIVLNDKLTLYARRDATDQLRDNRNVSVTITGRECRDSVYVVTARAVLPDGRTDESTGAVPLVKEGGEWKTAQSGKRYLAKDGTVVPLSPEERANAMMKAETKAKRRVTLSIVGLGWLDESEVDSVPQARILHVDTQTGEIKEPQVDAMRSTSKSSQEASQTASVAEVPSSPAEGQNAPAEAGKVPKTSNSGPTLRELNWYAEKLAQKWERTTEDYLAELCQNAGVKKVEELTPDRIAEIVGGMKAALRQPAQKGAK